jgi:hypothetical protein
MAGRISDSYYRRIIYIPCNEYARNVRLWSRRPNEREEIRMPETSNIVVNKLSFPASRVQAHMLHHDILDSYASLLLGS